MKSITSESVLSVINSCLSHEEITLQQVDDDLSELGMDSIAFIHIIVSLEEEFDCEIPDSKLLVSEMNTVNKILQVLNSVSEE